MKKNKLKTIILTILTVLAFSGTVLLSGCDAIVEVLEAAEEVAAPVADDAVQVETPSVVEPTAWVAETPTEAPTKAPVPATVSYRFRNDKLLTRHYEKHGIEMGFDSKESYEAAASAVINNPAALTKTENEDGDYVYYVESTNEFAVLSTDGYIRTYFKPDAGIKYYNKQ